MDITAQDGLLWRNGKYIPLPEADDVARQYGFVYAEEMVKALNSGIVPEKVEARK